MGSRDGKKMIDSCALERARDGIIHSSSFAQKESFKYSSLRGDSGMAGRVEKLFNFFL